MPPEPDASRTSGAVSSDESVASQGRDLNPGSLDYKSSA